MLEKRKNVQIFTMNKITSTTISALLLLVTMRAGCNAETLPLVVLEKEVDPYIYEYRFPECATSKRYNDLDYVCETDISHIPRYLCPAKWSEIATNCAREFCLYAKSSHKQDKCEVDIEPEIVPRIGLDGTIISCGKHENAKLYKFGYRICVNNDLTLENDFTHMVIYEFCFNEVWEKVIYVDYKIISPKLLKNANLTDKRDFESDIKYYGFNIIAFWEFRSQMWYHNRRKDMEKVMLIPPSHMALSHWKKPLYHEANVKLMKSHLTYLWDRINEYVKNLAIADIGEIRIKAGVFDSAPFELDASTWWKLVYDAEEKYAIAIIIDNVYTPLPIEQRCKSICDDNGWTNMIPEEMQGFAYCCPPSTIIDEMGFPPNVKVFNLNHFTIEYRKAFVVLKKETYSPLLDYRFPYCVNKNPIKDSIDYGLTISAYNVEYFCPPHTLDQLTLVFNTPHYNFCLLRNIDKENLGLDNCNRGTIEPEILPIKNTLEVHKSCGKNGIGLRYRCGYRLCFDNAVGFISRSFNMDVYEFCVDQQKKRIIYVDYKIISPRLLRNDILEDEKKFIGQERYFEILEKKKSPHSVQPATRTMLIPSSHMALRAWKKALIKFDYNYDFLLTHWSGLLNTINDYLSTIAIEKLGEIRIKTGVMNSPTASSEITIWWKLVYDDIAQNAIAIIIHNIVDEEKRGDKLCDCVCSQNGWEDMIPLGMEEVAYCCPPEVIVDQMGFQRVGILNLNSPRKVSHFEDTKLCKEI